MLSISAIDSAREKPVAVAIPPMMPSSVVHGAFDEGQKVEAIRSSRFQFGQSMRQQKQPHESSKTLATESKPEVNNHGLSLYV